MITGKLYDVLKFLAQVILPALGAAYFALAGIWGLPSAEQVVGTIVVIDTFLGALLQLSSAAYAKSGQRFDGAMNVIPLAEGGKTFSLELDGDPEDLEGKKEVVFKVQKKPKKRRGAAR